MSFCRTAVVCGILLVTLVFSHFIGESQGVPLRKPLSSFPMQIGAWKGTEARFDERIYPVLAVDESLLRHYRGPAGEQINVYIGYYRKQALGNLIHSPKNCLPGAGWRITKSGQEQLSVLGIRNGKTLANRLRLAKGGQNLDALYWFQSRDRFLASEYWQKLYLAADGLLRRRTDGALVLLTASVSSRDADGSFPALKELAEIIATRLKEHLPS